MSAVDLDALNPVCSKWTSCPVSPLQRLLLNPQWMSGQFGQELSDGDVGVPGVAEECRPVTPVSRPPRYGHRTCVAYSMMDRVEIYM